MEGFLRSDRAQQPSDEVAPGTATKVPTAHQGSPAGKGERNRDELQERAGLLQVPANRGWADVPPTVVAHW